MTMMMMMMMNVDGDCAGLPRYWGRDLHQSACGHRRVRNHFGLQSEDQRRGACQDPAQRQDSAWGPQQHQDLMSSSRVPSVICRPSVRSITVHSLPFLPVWSLFIHLCASFDVYVPLLHEGYRSHSHLVIYYSCDCRVSRSWMTCILDERAIDQQRTFVIVVLVVKSFLICNYAQHLKYGLTLWPSNHSVQFEIITIYKRMISLCPTVILLQ